MRTQFCELENYIWPPLERESEDEEDEEDSVSKLPEAWDHYLGDIV